MTREEAIEALNEIFDDSEYSRGVAWYGTAMDMAIKALEQPEIIRCKDCRHYEWMSNRISEEQTWHCHCWDADTGKDDFCSFAERRADE